MGRHEKAPVCYPYSRLATLHTALQTLILLLSLTLVDDRYFVNISVVVVVVEQACGGCWGEFGWKRQGRKGVKLVIVMFWMGLANGWVRLDGLIRWLGFLAVRGRFLTVVHFFHFRRTFLGCFASVLVHATG